MAAGNVGDAQFGGAVDAGTAIAPGHAHLWISRVSDRVDPTVPATVLTSAEREQWAKFRRSVDRNLYHSSRTLQYEVGARLLGHPVVIDRTCIRCGEPHGRPGWVGAGELDYSVSHSGNVLVMIVANGGRVGIDIEQARSQGGVSSGWRDVSRDVLTPAEAAELAAPELAPSNAEREFLRLWCRKEAVVKATGEGLLADLTAIDVRGGRARTSDAGTDLWLQDLPLPPDVVGAVASTIPELTIHPV
jgi:4'-phosphopantetheinyl transferase